MNRAVFLALIAGAFAFTASCAQQGPGGGPGSGGEQGSGGSSGSGASGSGGATSSSGGATANSGGMTGSSSGGATSSTGGMTASSGGMTGSSSGGATSSTGGMTASSGGMTGSGSGGAAGSGTTGNLAQDVVPDLAKGFYWEASCMGTITVTGKNCPWSGTGSTCPSNGIDRSVMLNVGGEAGKKYTVNIEVRGVAGTRCYKGGMRASNAAPKEDDYNNWWYIGGSYANPTGWWNSYELHVTPSTGDPSKDVYYFNGSDNDGGNYCEREASYLVGYTASFKVMGGGKMEFKIHDQNCKALQNCGKDIDSNSPCAPRKVDLSMSTAQPPASSPASSANQPPKNMLDKTWYPQWMWVVATSVTPSS